VRRRSTALPGEIHGEALHGEHGRLSGLESGHSKLFWEGGIGDISGHIDRTRLWCSRPFISLRLGQINLDERGTRAGQSPGATVIASTEDDDLADASIQRSPHQFA
jgi:hypothetical protein